MLRWSKGKKRKKKEKTNRESKNQTSKPFTVIPITGGWGPGDWGAPDKKKKPLFPKTNRSRNSIKYGRFLHPPTFF